MSLIVDDFFKDEYGKPMRIHFGADLTNADVIRLFVIKPLSKEVVEWTPQKKQGDPVTYPNETSGLTVMEYVLGDGDIDECGEYIGYARATGTGFKDEGQDFRFTVVEHDTT